MSDYIKIGGSQKKIANVFVKVGGVWKCKKRGFVLDQSVLDSSDILLNHIIDHVFIKVNGQWVNRSIFFRLGKSVLDGEDVLQ